MDGPWVVYFQNCVRGPQPPSKMAAMSRHSFNIERMAVWDLNSNLDLFGMQTFLRGLIYVR